VLYFFDAEYNNGVLSESLLAMVRSISHGMFEVESRFPDLTIPRLGKPTALSVTVPPQCPSTSAQWLRDNLRGFRGSAKIDVMAQGTCPSK
jgi:hypothetical protein